jgi:redox-sensitive bicupin YhaK (pirin superfamily)
MSVKPTDEPECRGSSADDIELVVEGRPRDLGSFAVRRMLPSEQRQRVGPFIFFDHVDRVLMPPGQGFDVRPHPHISLATITYLLEGEFVHRDSLGSVQVIRPGDVNWMIAGRGIVHSERTSPEVRARGGALHAVQSWVALPLAHEETEPRFEHHPEPTIPRIVRRGAVLRVIAGTAYGAQAPTGVLSPTLYVHAKLDAGAVLPIDDEHEQRAVYVARGGVECQGRSFSSGALVLLRAGATVTMNARADTDLMLIGGAPLEGERHVYWNFVSSRMERIERAKMDWREGRFAKVPTDAEEFIPLPGE